MDTATPDQSHEDTDKPKPSEKVGNAIEATGFILETLMVILETFSG